MKIVKRFLLGMGSIGAIAAPAMTIIACTSKEGNSISTGGYSGSMTQLATGAINVAGAWGDSRFYAGDNAKDIHVVGVQKKRISNDGIQARKDMKPGDQYAFQLLFKALIKAANKQKADFKTAKKSKTNEKLTTYSGAKDLLLEMKGKVKTIFEVYSHADYKSLTKGDKINYLEKGEVKTKDAIPSANNGPATAFKAADSEFFSAVDTSGSDITQFGIKKEIKITFIPSNDKTYIREAITKLTAFLLKRGTKSKIVISDDYGTAAQQLEKKLQDLVFLPVDAWHEDAPTSNFIIQAVRPTQINSLDFSDSTQAKISIKEITSEQKAIEIFNKYGQLYLKDVTTTALGGQKLSTAQTAFKEAAKEATSDEKKIMVLADKIAGQSSQEEFNQGFYEAWIYTKKGSDIDKVITAANKTAGWKISFDKIKDILKYGYTGTTSSASYVFPELWFRDHFEGFEGFE